MIISSSCSYHFVYLGMLHHYLARGLYRKFELRDVDGSSNHQEHIGLTKLHDIQRYAVKFWKENPHFDTLTESYKRDPELLMKEANIIEQRLLELTKDHS